VRPLQSLSSLKLKLGVVIVAAVWITAVTTIVAVRQFGLPSIVGIIAAILVLLSGIGTGGYGYRGWGGRGRV